MKLGIGVIQYDYDMTERFEINNKFLGSDGSNYIKVTNIRCRYMSIQKIILKKHIFVISNSRQFSSLQVEMMKCKK